MKDLVKLDRIYGHVELIPAYRYEDGCIVMGGICKEYDGDGLLVKTSHSDNLKVLLISTFIWDNPWVL